MPELGQSNRHTQRFVCRFAAGKNSQALSGVWRVWAAKKKPDLYIAARSIGQIKATVHCPTVEKPTWARHFGFDFNAKGHVAQEVWADGGSRHKATWSGAQIGHGMTVEWRVMLLGTALRTDPLPVDDDVFLVAPPSEGKCLIFVIMLGPKMQLSCFPQAKDAQTYLLADGRLCDGRQVWITYCYTEAMPVPVPKNQNPRRYGSADDLRRAAGELRAFAVADNSDGSLVFWDLRVESRGGDD